ncbi:3-hydroxyacyl-CoA dehydrogenase NAD-binding domain-containing protein [Achromobacter xylosoxidans]|uniref:3-hydroxyacyl-CoA dehydrogenase NAD-binding domain-containing protein n=1 Tax=Alcaligenes xylosoxydans xylosoxydans TaxID=85698 RepID=UPI0006C5A706|nr:3-hydroxyacyl-CoA dehydrogenase NAD-binding domain-containing protein [Achromobacter xylosoxidans]MDH0523970.1 3-hydroxyacyl-CoA dehydrogenase NAD-binding domain-containing protein [Achromobacter xylosoxidans]MDH0547523.1 3-hydroxyacyl-CoA dehydrogenase NAD-binding domain-containing protein [Achromobacter xylosoxidans]CUJ47777.1 Probable 3-hydroxybutyryl-CoA dehydrogenase [Achromobacter xylosoxidans]
MTDTSPSPAIRRVAIVGAGTIGASWAALFLAYGLEVVVCDPAADAESLTRARVAAAWPVLTELGRVAAGASPEALRFDADLAGALRGVDFVQENGPEREDFKTDLFARMDALLPPEVIVASSSSGLIMSRLQARCPHAARFVIGHPFNPPHLIPLVEVVGGKQTSEATVERCIAFYRQLGKHPIRVNKEVPGHIANRLQAALWREAIHLAADNVASVADIDAAVSQGPGLRWALFGPHMTFNLGGGAGGMAHFMDHLLGPIQTWWDDLGTPEVTPELRRRLIEGVNAEAGQRDIADLVRDRDAQLTALLKVLQR